MHLKYTSAGYGAMKQRITSINMVYTLSWIFGLLDHMAFDSEWHMGSSKNLG